MQVFIVIVIVIAVLVVIGVLIAKRRKPAAPATPTATPEADSRAAAVPEPPPMNDLESALSEVTDSTGRPLRDHIDAETGHVDELRVPDDTGPLLRRALDHVEKPADELTDNDTDAAGTNPSDGSDTAPSH